jgi:hypothetical protein
MLLKTLAAATAAALFALSTATFAQGSGSPAATGASTDVPAKCVGLTGTERDKCLREQRSGAGSGATGSGSISGGSSTTPTSPSTPSSSPSSPSTTPGGAGSSGGTSK